MSPEKPTAPIKQKDPIVLKYLEQQYGMSTHEATNVTPESAPFLSFDSGGSVTLFDNPELHKIYHIPKGYTAVLDNLDHLKTMFHADTYTPKFDNVQLAVIKHQKITVP